MYFDNSKPQVVYRAAITRREKADVSLRWIFVSDVYVIEKDGYYVNYFDRNESFCAQNSLIGFDQENITYDQNDIQLRALKEYKYDELDVIENMLFNPNYCKDRLRVMEEALRRGLVLDEKETKRYLEVLQFDAQFNDRYEAKVKQKK